MKLLEPLTLIAILATATLACSITDDPDPDTPVARDAPVLEGSSYAITSATALSNEQVHAIAQFVEAQGQDVHQAKVQIHGETLELELWGGEVPGPELADALRQEFAYLGDAQIDVAALGAADAPGPSDHGIEPGDDPETIKQKIIDDLRAQGVEGEIEVTVTPTGDGHHEVDVQVHDEQPG